MGVLEQGAAAAVFTETVCLDTRKMGTKTQTLLQSSTPSPLSPILFLSAPHPLAEHHHFLCTLLGTTEMWTCADACKIMFSNGDENVVHTIALQCKCSRDITHQLLEYTPTLTPKEISRSKSSTVPVGGHKGIQQWQRHDAIKKKIRGRRVNIFPPPTTIELF